MLTFENRSAFTFAEISLNFGALSLNTIAFRPDTFDLVHAHLDRSCVSLKLLPPATLESLKTAAAEMWVCEMSTSSSSSRPLVRPLSASGLAGDDAKQSRGLRERQSWL